MMEKSKSIELINQHFNKIKWQGDEVNCQCPFPGHSDNTPSFSINTDKGVYYCHSCNKKGTLNSLFKELNIEDYQNNYNDNTEYKYKIDGKLIFTKNRYTKDDNSKGFSIKPTLKELKNKNAIPFEPLYNYDLLQKASWPVIITEGEKDADTITKLGYIGITNPFGAGKWKDEYNKQIPSSVKKIYIVGDYDTPGQNHINLVADKLSSQSRKIYIIDLGYPIEETHGKDVTDWINDGHNKNEFTSLLKNAVQYESANKPRLIMTSLEDLDNEPELEYLIDDILIKDTVNMLTGYAGIGKTFLALDICKSILQDIPLWGMDVNSTGPILWINEDMNNKLLKNRIKRMGFMNHKLPFHFFNFQVFNINEDKCMNEFIEIVKNIKPDLVIFDCLRRVHNANENSSEEMAATMGNFRKIANLGTTVLMLHHSTKGNGNDKYKSRGSGDITAAIDQELYIEEKNDFIILKSLKSRFPAIQPLKLKIIDADNDSLSIDYFGKAIPLEQERYNKIKGYFKEKKSGEYSDIYDYFDRKIGKNTIKNIVHKLIEENEITELIVKKGKKIFTHSCLN